MLLSACGTGDTDRSSVEGTGKEASAPPIESIGETSSNTPAVTFKPSESDDLPIASKPGGPVNIEYRVIGAAIVGHPVAVDLRISSAMGDRPMRVNYRMNDPTAMQLAESQPSGVSLPSRVNQEFREQQVTVIPQREGRLYLNVSVEIETDNGSMSTVTAVPIQVGTAPRELRENGQLGSDENGESIRSLPAKED